MENPGILKCLVSRILKHTKFHCDLLEGVAGFEVSGIWKNPLNSFIGCLESSVS
jgi:hypothetical protein